MQHCKEKNYIAKTMQKCIAYSALTYQNFKSIKLISAITHPDDYSICCLLENVSEWISTSASWLYP